MLENGIILDFPNIIRLTLPSSPKKLAKQILKHPNKRGIEYLPWWWSLIMFIVKILPSSITSKL